VKKIEVRLHYCTPFGVPRLTNELLSPSPGPHGYYRSECCIGGETMAAPPVNHFLAPTHNAEDEVGLTASIIFQVFPKTPSRIEPSLSALVARGQPTIPLSR